jgi:S1-C subfamily serine protease
MTHRKQSLWPGRAGRVSRAFLVALLLAGLTAAAGFAQPKAETSKVDSKDAAGVQADQAAVGVLVIAVQKGSPADKAGVARGDIILEANGKAVNDARDLREAVVGHAAGDTVSFKLRHGDAQKSISVTIGTQEGRPWVGILPLPGRDAQAFASGDFPRGMMGGENLGDGTRGYGPGMRGYGAMFAAEGALVQGVTTGSPAEKAGLKHGDLILSVDGTTVDARATLGDLVAAKKVGDTVTLSVTSWGQETAHDVKVTLDKNPSKDVPYLGVQYLAAPPRFGGGPDRDRPNGGPGMMAGAFVVDVAADGPAAKAGVQARDVVVKVDDVQVTSPQQVLDAVGKHKPGDTLALTVLRKADRKQIDITVTLGQNPKDAARAWLGLSMGGGFGPGRFGPGRAAPGLSGESRPLPSPAGANTPTL